MTTRRPIHQLGEAALFALSWAAIFAMCWVALSLQPAQGETWVDIHLASHHFGERITDSGSAAEWQQINPGLGIDHALTERISTVAGIYHNSINRSSWYAGAHWRAADAGPLSFGAMAVAVTGYTQRDAALLGTATYTRDRLRIRAVFAPPISGVTAGFIGLQIGVNLP